VTRDRREKRTTKNAKGAKSYSPFQLEITGFRGDAIHEVSSMITLSLLWRARKPVQKFKPFNPFELIRP
jgi:hypothetical protein